MIKVILLSMILLFLCSCTEDKPKRVDVDTEYIGLVDANTPEKFTFRATKNKDNSFLCEVPTVHLRTTQHVESITAYYIGDQLYIHIESMPDMWPEPLDRRVRVKFYMYNLPVDTYKLSIIVGNGSDSVIPKIHKFE